MLSCVDGKSWTKTENMSNMYWMDETEMDYVNSVSYIKKHFDFTLSRLNTVQLRLI